MEIQLRITSRMMCLIGRIERVTGRLERISLLTQLEGDGSVGRCINDNSRAVSILDDSVGPFLAAGGGDELFEESDDFRAVLASHQRPFSLDSEGFASLAQDALPSVVKNGAPFAAILRRSNGVFLAPDRQSGRVETLFSTVPPFLLEQRLTELLAWAEGELESGDIHPLLVLGTFHLLLLQLSPLERGNHRVALLALWHLLKDHGYLAVRYRSLLQCFSQNERAYFNALRQAEKSVFNTWNTVNIWLEFFLQSLQGMSEDLYEGAENKLERQRLTAVQRQIVEAIRVYGPVTRERIVDETGINISTVKYNLGVLAVRGVLNRKGGGRTTSYTLAM